MSRQRPEPKPLVAISFFKGFEKINSEKLHRRCTGNKKEDS
jgi:hypothetical protein